MTAVTRLSFAFAALCAFTGCQTLGTSPRPLGADEFARLVARPDYRAAVDSPTSSAWVFDALDTVNRLQTARDSAK